MFESLVFIDRALFLFFNRTISNPVFDIFFTFITRRNSWIIPLTAAAIIFMIWGKKRALVAIGLVIVAVAISDPLCVRVIKPLVHRLRPCHPSYFIDGQHLFLTGGNFLFGYKKSFSFPSAHAMNWFAGATVLGISFTKGRVWLFIIAFLVAFSRVYVGVHYPFDIAGGAFLGTVIGVFVHYVYSYAKQHRIFKRKTINQNSQNA